MIKKNSHFDLLSFSLRLLTRSAIIITTLILLFIIGYIFINGIPHMKPSLFAFEYNSINVSLFPAMINTITMTALALLVAAPFGISTA
ncbi:MAG: hypothetical protein PHN21_05680, partial [Erysipelotrichaceae bacterium]|nr:hypothetical protein [Erysipelotrichaceae bacterium]